MAERRGLKLSKSATRDPKALTYGAWIVLDAGTGQVVFGAAGFAAPRYSLDDVEQFLEGEK